MTIRDSKSRVIGVESKIIEHSWPCGSSATYSATTTPSAAERGANSLQPNIFRGSREGHTTAAHGTAAGPPACSRSSPEGPAPHEVLPSDVEGPRQSDREVYVPVEQLRRRRRRRGQVRIVKRKASLSPDRSHSKVPPASSTSPAMAKSLVTWQTSRQERHACAVEYHPDYEDTRGRDRGRAGGGAAHGPRAGAQAEGAEASARLRSTEAPRIILDNSAKPIFQNRHPNPAGSSWLCEEAGVAHP